MFADLSSSGRIRGVIDGLLWILDWVVCVSAGLFLHLLYWALAPGYATLGRRFPAVCYPIFYVVSTPLRVAMLCVGAGVVLTVTRVYLGWWPSETRLDASHQIHAAVLLVVTAGTLTAAAILLLPMHGAYFGVR